MASHVDQPLYLEESDARAARRFARWLHDYVQPSVRVVKRPDGGYALGIAGNTEWPSTGALNQRCRDETLSGGPVYGIPYGSLGFVTRYDRRAASGDSRPGPGGYRERSRPRSR